jgi:16S rRNA (guanine527-N7)-methyltransferase
MDTLEEEIKKHFPEDWGVILEIFDKELILEFSLFLREKNEEGGFFSKKDSESILERHLLESIYSVYALVGNNLVSRETRIADVGTGPGLPGFLFLCLKEHPHLTLIDGSRRKLGLLEEWWKITKLKFPGRRLEFRYGRAEELKGSFHSVCMRASIPYPFSIEAVCKLVGKSGFFLPFLGKEYPWEEIETRILSECGFMLEGVLYLDDLGFLGERQIRVLKKVREPKNGHPREWKRIAKEIKETKWAE